MFPRAPRYLVALLLVLVSTSMHADRRRAVRAPGPACTYTLSLSLPDPIPDGGLTRARVGVTATPANRCAGWNAYADVPWITFETDEAQAATFVTFAPNTTAQLRSGNITIGGQTFAVHQAATVVVSPPGPVNLLQNGGFDVNLANWGWQDRFPNAIGTATWSSFDANGSMFSGSIRLTDDTSSGPAYQQLQCINAQPGVYDYGFAVRANTRDGVRGIIAFLQLEGENCSGNYATYVPQQVRVDVAGVWERHTYTGVLSEGRKSILIVIGGWARQPGVQEVWLDDIYVNRR